jgi:hypothetical protein
MYMRAGRVKAAVVTLSLDLILGWQYVLEDWQAFWEKKILVLKTL